MPASTKNQETSASTDEDRKNDSIAKFLRSENLTLEMALNYLYMYRKNSKLTSLLLDKLKHFCLVESVHYIPTIMYILHRCQFHYDSRLSGTVLQILLGASQRFVPFVPSGQVVLHGLLGRREETCLEPQKQAGLLLARQDQIHSR